MILFICRLIGFGLLAPFIVLGAAWYIARLGISAGLNFAEAVDRHLYNWLHREEETS